MRKIYVILFFIFPQVLFAQTRSITGVITDVQGNVVELATVIAKDSIGKAIGGAVSDSLGRFAMNISSRSGCIMNVSCIGYKDCLLPLDYKATSLNITLQNTSNELGEVTVTAKTPLFRRDIDRLIFNAEKLNSTATNFLDVLRRTPGVVVQDDDISMINKGKIFFLMNGRELKMDSKSLVAYLGSLSSERLKQIEVMTTPPAKYSAEGNAGIINFVTKELRNNYFGGNVSNRLSIKERVYDNFNVGLQYKRERLEEYLNVEAGTGTMQTNSSNSVYYPEETWNTSKLRLKSNNYVLGTYGLDYALSGNSSIGFIASYNNMRPDADTKAKTNVYSDPQDVARTKYFETATNFDSDYNRHNENLHYTLDSIGKGGKLDVNVDYLNYRINDKAELASDYDETLSYLNKTKTNIDIFGAKADMEMSVGRTRLSYGTAYSYSKTNNQTDYDYISTDANLNDHFIYIEHIMAAYVDANWKFSDKWEAKLGIRGEYGKLIGESLTMNLCTRKRQLDLFPTMYLCYTINDRSTLSTTVSGRINRPSYVDINPFTTYTDAHTVRSGNPNLLPEKSYSWYIDYTLGNLSLSANVNWRNRVIFDYTAIDNSQKLTKIYIDNVMRKRMCSLDATYYLDKVSWLDSSVSFSLYNIHSEPMADYDLKTVDHTSVFVYMDNNIYLDQKRNLTLNLWEQYQSKEEDALGESPSRYRVDLGVKCFLLSKKLSVSLEYQNLLSSHNKYIVQSGEATYEMDSEPYRVFNLTLSYLFGKSVNIQHKKIGIDTNRL